MGADQLALSPVAQTGMLAPAHDHRQARLLRRCSSQTHAQHRTSIAQGVEQSSRELSCPLAKAGRRHAGIPITAGAPEICRSLLRTSQSLRSPSPVTSIRHRHPPASHARDCRVEVGRFYLRHRRRRVDGAGRRFRPRCGVRFSLTGYAAYFSGPPGLKRLRFSAGTASVSCCRRDWPCRSWFSRGLSRWCG